MVQNLTILYKNIYSLTCLISLIINSNLLFTSRSKSTESNKKDIEYYKTYPSQIHKPTFGLDIAATGGVAPNGNVELVVLQILLQAHAKIYSV